MKKTPNILSIAGSDPSGGAGIQADLKTFAALGGYGMAVITALTAQNTQGVSGVMDVDEAFVRQQIEAIFQDIHVDAVKIGMLSNAEIIKVVADILEKYQSPNIVLDPVMVSTSGDSLISADAAEAMKEHLIPLADVLTPNIPEAEKLSRKAVLDMEEAALGLLSLGCEAVYLKGGHLKTLQALDVLAKTGGITKTYEAERIDTQNTHGTGCTLSSALAAYLGHGMELEEACGAAKNYLTKALAHAGELDVGCGHGPVHHGWKNNI
ncbi:MAG: bifunctional hydroxymethylpyrimidine kinase/phosphomethylpyrimidine kinase [Alphaproteobacteria bacterium]|nr:bifunctional hydroxymethylpyrimidine kinase/phosphomethylpyrimidine kinase [Alphaproteobacteria bacterium]